MNQCEKKNVEIHGFKFNVVFNGKSSRLFQFTQMRLIAKNWLDWSEQHNSGQQRKNHPKIARTVNCAGGTIQTIPIFIAVMPVQSIPSINAYL